MPKEMELKQQMGVSRLMHWFQGLFSRRKGTLHHLSSNISEGENPQLSSESQVSPYFINFDPSPTKLSMFFGRRHEIGIITNYLRKGESVLLVGERRIGKTFFLHMIADLAKKGAFFYTGLLDKETGQLLAKFHQSTASWQWVYIDMLVVTNASGFYFNVLTGLAGGKKTIHGNINESLTIDHLAFVDEIKKLSDSYSRKGQRAVVLVDESEKFIDLDKGAEILSCLKSVIQQCAAIDFVLAGDIKKQHETQELLSLKTAMQLIYIGSLSPMEAKAFIQLTMRNYVILEEPTLNRIHELTGGKPSLLQILCDVFFEFIVSSKNIEGNITLELFNELWETTLRNKVFEKFDFALRDFFEGLQDDDKNVFSFLAHHPLATINDLTTALGISPEIVSSSLQRFSIAQKIMKDGIGYRIISRIVEDYGSRFLVCPSCNQLTKAKVAISLEDMLKGEGDIIEYKSTMRWDLQTKQVNRELEKSITKSVAAFLNSAGGILLIGVSDDRTLIGLDCDLKTLKKQNIDGFQLKLQEILSNALGAEYSHYYLVSFEETRNKTICIIRIYPSPAPVFLTDQGKIEFYIRVGNMTQSLDIESSNKYIRMHWPELK